MSGMREKERNERMRKKEKGMVNVVVHMQHLWK
jgi:hypothetical protein